MNKILKRNQPYNPYWVRREVFPMYFDDVDKFCNMINQQTHIIHFGYGPFQYTGSEVNMPLYYLEKEELTEAIQAKDLKDAPADAVEWNSAS